MNGGVRKPVLKLIYVSMNVTSKQTPQIQFQRAHDLTFVIECITDQLWHWQRKPLHLKRITWLYVTSITCKTHTVLTASVWLSQLCSIVLHACYLCSENAVFIHVAHSICHIDFQSHLEYNSQPCFYANILF